MDTYLRTNEQEIRQCQVFLADDDPNDRLLFEFSLRYKFPSCTFHAFDSGAYLLETLAELGDGSRLPDVIFLNLTMPGMSGDQTYWLLQQNPRWASIPTVILTGSEVGRN